MTSATSPISTLDRARQLDNKVQLANAILQNWKLFPTITLSQVQEAVQCLGWTLPSHLSLNHFTQLPSVVGKEKIQTALQKYIKDLEVDRALDWAMGLNEQIDSIAQYRLALPNIQITEIAKLNAQKIHITVLETIHADHEDETLAYLGHTFEEAFLVWNEIESLGQMVLENQKVFVDYLAILAELRSFINHPMNATPAQWAVLTAQFQDIANQLRLIELSEPSEQWSAADMVAKTAAWSVIQKHDYQLGMGDWSNLIDILRTLQEYALVSGEEATFSQSLQCLMSFDACGVQLHRTAEVLIQVALKMCQMASQYRTLTT